MKIKKILKEITKLHEENNDIKIQLLKKQRSLDCVNKERDDLFLENKRLKAENCKLLVGNKGLKEDLKTFALQLGHSVEEVQYAPGKTKMDIFKDEDPEEIQEKEVRQMIEDIVRETTEEISEETKEIAKHFSNLFKEEQIHNLFRKDPSEIEDIEDELNEASNSNKFNPCQADEEVGYFITMNFNDEGYNNLEAPAFSYINPIKKPSAFYLKKISNLDNPFVYLNSDLMFTGFYSNAEVCINSLKIKHEKLLEAYRLINNEHGIEHVRDCYIYLQENGFRLLYEKIRLTSDIEVEEKISTQIFDIAYKLGEDIEYLEKHAT